jgi:hypothetical protein
VPGNDPDSLFTSRIIQKPRPAPPISEYLERKSRELHEERFTKLKSKIQAKREINYAAMEASRKARLEKFD